MHYTKPLSETSTITNTTNIQPLTINSLNDNRQKQSSPLQPIDKLKSDETSQETIISNTNEKSSSHFDGPTSQQILSQMTIYNAFRTDSSLSTDSSLASDSGIKPSATLLTNSGNLDLSTLSKSYTILLIIRKFVVQGGCPFCNRRMSEINEWRRSLLQLGIVPIVLHSEVPEVANSFFRDLCNPQLRDIWRVSDPSYTLTNLLCNSQLAPDLGNATPLEFNRADRFYALKKITKLIPVLKEGYFDPSHHYKEEKKMKVEQFSLDVTAKIMLIRNDRVLKVWDHKKEDHAPDILGDVIMGMDLVSREVLGEDIIDEQNDQGDEQVLLMEVEDEKNEKMLTSPNQVEISMEGMSDSGELKSLRNQTLPTIKIPTQFERKTEEPGSPLSPTSPTKSFNSILETLQMNIDIYRKQKGKFEFTKITIEEQEKQLQEKTLMSKRKLEDLKAKKVAPTNSTHDESNGCIPFRRVSNNRSKTKASTSLHDLGENIGSMKKIIENEKKRRYLKLFSAREYNAESILFWEDVNLLYKKLFSSNPSTKSRVKIVEHSNRIAMRYLLDENSLFLLNTTKRMKDQIRENLPESPLDLKNQQDIETAMKLFDSVMDDIMAHVLPDIYVRFLFSNEYKQMKIELGIN